MSDERNTGQPAARSLDGVLDELRLVLSPPASSPDAAPSAPAATDNAPVDAPAAAPAEPVVPLTLFSPADAPVETPPPPAPVAFEIVAPAEIAPIEAPSVLPPPIPTGIETTSDSWSLMTDAAPSSAPSFIQPEAALAPDVPEPAPAPSFAAADAFSLEPALNAPEAPALPPAIPIPGTMETREVPEAEPADLNDLEHAASRPDGLVQIACLFPEGGEKTGQSFVNRLKETAARLKKPLTVQPVFLHTWSPDAVDIAAWAKSAALSGADAMFVIAPRASAPLFAKLAIEAAGAGTTGRVVATELIPSAALYADVLVDLKRKASGPR